MICDFNARTGNLDDCLLLDGEINKIESRANRDTKINSKGRLLVDLCKTTKIAILNGRIGEDKHIGEYTCVTHNGKSSVDYFLAEHCCFDSILNLSVKNFDPSLADVHCCRRLREANKTSNHCVRKAAANEYKLFLLQKKSKWDFDTNQLLRQKKLDNPKEYWSFFKRLSRELNNIPIEKSKLYDHFKYLKMLSKLRKFLLI